MFAEEKEEAYNPATTTLHRGGMDPERWNQINRLLESVLERAPAERDVFLRRACEGDQQLEREVRLLLGAHFRADSFLSVPAIDLAARQLTGRRGGDDARPAAIH